jgi:hypothetical protein
MMSYTQDVLSSIWQKLTDGTERDADDLLDVSELVDMFLLAGIVTDKDLEQTLMLSTVVTYSDSNSDPTTVSYTRIRLNKDAPWGKWERKN